MAGTVTLNGAKAAGGVIVVVDYHSYLPPAVEVAIALANSRRLALRGLLVEDPDLERVSALPFSQEVILSSARPRALEKERLRRTLQGFERRFQSLLSQGAERAALEYSFSSVLGRRQAMEQPNSDYLVLGQPRPHREPVRASLRVLLVGADPEAALPVLESLLSAPEGRKLELTLVEGTLGAGQVTRLREFVAQHPGATCLQLPARQLAGVFRAVDHTPDLVVATRQCGAELLDTLLKLAACPVILSA